MNLWPSPGRGVRNAQFTSTHLTNLLLALRCGDPVRAVETVETFRDLRPEPTTWKTASAVTETSPNKLISAVSPEVPVVSRQVTVTQSLHADYPIFEQTTLGGVLDWLIETLADPSCDKRLLRVLRDIEVFVTIEPTPSAEVTLSFPEGTLSTSYHLHAQQQDSSLSNQGQNFWKHQCVFYGAAFDALATLWNEAKVASGHTTVPSDGRALSTNENAAPGRAASPSLPVEPKLAHTARSSLNNCDITARVCVPSRGFDPGDFPSNPRSDLHERPDQYASTRSAQFHRPV